MRARTARWSWLASPRVIRSLRLTMGLLLGAEATLALWMTGLVWDITRNLALFPSATRHPISIVGLIAGTTLALYCGVLGLVTLTALGRVTTLQQRLCQEAMRVHVAVGLVACVVWLWTFWMFDLGTLVTVALMAIPFAWGRLVAWTLAPRQYELERVHQTRRSELWSDPQESQSSDR